MSKSNKDHFESLSKEILKINSSLRWIAIADSNGTLLNIARRDGLEPLMTRQENQEYTLNAIARHKSRLKFEGKLGRLVYSLGKYEKLVRIVTPIKNKYYVLLTVDVEEPHIDSLMREQIIPKIKDNIQYFE
ncbi:MAG: hypothetical protein QOA14_02330 [Nitrososphaeraceae archaeon]|jgi:hypothetical protein|nr:hypothetical protein [Nitrososphaeraceae archaeon]MDW0164525.1 hypothetical protein [Nitrososphaeraceae archaeon]MDW0168320.1 hypothetical protein [Nitrososphaeraceae archaeon]MDW0171836.1 hypothetical protein [Nitrososphaeraceae archaeon]MDW0173290.1 hypothetical protein [Nitrososphaeraceae archaeon]